MVPSGHLHMDGDEDLVLDGDFLSTPTSILLLDGDFLSTPASIHLLGLDPLESRSKSRKVKDPELLEAIRLTIINNMLAYHPESSSQLAMGEAFGVSQPNQKIDVDIATHIHVYNDGPERSLLCVETADRPGLIVDLVKNITDINIDVESGEFDTEGLLAKAKFHVSYKGKALIRPLQQVLENSLRYFLRRPTTEDASF
nr:ACT domain-containing protein DS12, chloroplastic [Ipomoea batatas]